jgi:uncharacterized protein (TIGR02594 family)
MLLMKEQKEKKKEKGKRAPWMEIAWKEESKKLIETGNNKEIWKFFRKTAYEKLMGTKNEKGEPINERTVSWCAAFVNWVMTEYGYKGIQTSYGYDAVRAVKWAEWSEGKDIKKPVYGAIAVKTRKGGGHVGFVAGKKGNSIIILGGNQSDKLQCSTYSVSDFFAYIVPMNYEVTEEDYKLPEYTGNPAAKGTES